MTAYIALPLTPSCVATYKDEGTRMSGDAVQRLCSSLHCSILSMMRFTCGVWLEPHHDGCGRRELVPAKVGEPHVIDCAGPSQTAAGYLGCGQTAPETNSGVRAATKIAGDAADVVRRSAVVATRRRNATTSREVRNARMAIAQLCTEGDVLVRHVIVGSGDVPCRIRIAGVLCEVGRSASGRRSVDRRQQS